MVLYRGKYELDGLAAISPEMEKDLDLAYDICQSLRDELPCEMCGRCCHQPNIIIRPEEIDRVASAANLTPFMFKRNYVVEMPDGRFLINKQNDGPCPFLGEDKRCTIWKDRPQICDDFPYAVSMFMSRVYLALTNPDADIMKLTSYMDMKWPCTKVIRRSIKKKIDERREDVILPDSH
jgi:Fe-S-cluster containining protein